MFAWGFSAAQNLGCSPGSEQSMSENIFCPSHSHLQKRNHPPLLRDQRAKAVRERGTELFQGLTVLLAGQVTWPAVRLISRCLSHPGELRDKIKPGAAHGPELAAGNRFPTNINTFRAHQLERGPQARAECADPAPSPGTSWAMWDPTHPAGHSSCHFCLATSEHPLTLLDNTAGREQQDRDLASHHGAMLAENQALDTQLSPIWHLYRDSQPQGSCCGFQLSSSSIAPQGT